MMGLIGRIERMNTYRKKQYRSLICRLRAAMKKATSSRGGIGGGSKQHMRFQYDPSSYALNFDDGCQEKDYDYDYCTRFIRHENHHHHHHHRKLQDCLSITGIHISKCSGTWVCVLLVKI